MHLAGRLLRRDLVTKAIPEAVSFPLKAVGIDLEVGSSSVAFGRPPTDNLGPLLILALHSCELGLLVLVHLQICRALIPGLVGLVVRIASILTARLGQGVCSGGGLGVGQLPIVRGLLGGSIGGLFLSLVLLLGIVLVRIVIFVVVVDIVVLVVVGSHS